MSLEVVTYANKSSGMFEELINNEHGVKVKVLGMGKKWNGYLDKSKGLLEYMKTKKDDDIIVFIDGFDTKINKDISNVKSLFESYECKVLFSKHPDMLDIGFRFPRCDDKNIGRTLMGQNAWNNVLIATCFKTPCSNANNRTISYVYMD